jgi:hypothetical protein
MPRKSHAALSLVHPRVDGHPTYVSPSPHLSPAHRKIFTDVVRTMPPEHFRDCDVPILMRFVEAIAMCERAGREMEVTGGPVVDGVVNTWFGVYQKSAWTVSIIATRLRMTPHARRDPKTVARSHYKPNVYDRIAADARDEDEDQSA